MNVRLATIPHRIVIELGGEETVISTTKALELYRQLGIALAKSEQDVAKSHVSRLYVLEDDERGDLFLAGARTCIAALRYARAYYAEARELGLIPEYERMAPKHASDCKYVSMLRPCSCGGAP